jgi:hypothetical protein
MLSEAQREEICVQKTGTGLLAEIGRDSVGF